jgi:hypothetical protein
MQLIMHQDIKRMRRDDIKEGREKLNTTAKGCHAA